MWSSLHKDRDLLEEWTGIYWILDATAGRYCWSLLTTPLSHIFSLPLFSLHDCFLFVFVSSRLFLFSSRPSVCLSVCLSVSQSIFIYPSCYFLLPLSLCLSSISSFLFVNVVKLFVDTCISRRGNNESGLKMAIPVHGIMQAEFEEDGKEIKTIMN